MNMRARWDSKMASLTVDESVIRRGRPSLYTVFVMGTVRPGYFRALVAEPPLDLSMHDQNN